MSVAFDRQKLIAEIAARHQIRLESDDPIFTVVTLNQLVMEDTVAEMLKAMAATLSRFEASIERAENRAGGLLAESVKDSGALIRRMMQEDIRAANLKTNELVRRLDAVHNRRALRFWAGIALLCTVILCAGSFWLGQLTAIR
jgi:hypothetical protein